MAMSETAFSYAFIPWMFLSLFPSLAQLFSRVEDMRTNVVLLEFDPHHERRLTILWNMIFPMNQRSCIETGNEENTARIRIKPSDLLTQSGS